MAKARNYKGQPYWEQEQPVTADSKRSRVSYYRQAGKLQVSQLWPDRETGEMRNGRTVTLDQEDMELNPAVLELLKEALEEWE